MRLVDLDALLNELNTKAPDDSSGIDYDVWERGGYDIAVDVVKEAPIINAVRHGKWIYSPAYISMSGKYLKARECSVCHAYYVIYGNELFKTYQYCPNCGAKMDGE